MRLLADENFPLPSVELLRRSGHDVVAIPEEEPGTEDTLILERSVREGRIILTFDRDFGELIYRRGLLGPPGVIHFRYEPPSPEEPGQRLLELLADSSTSWVGQYSVIERARVRQRGMR